MEKHPGLLFLDVELSGTTAMTFLSEIRESITWNMQVVFYTSYSKYMIHAIRGAIFDFLRKPIDSSELDIIIERFIQSTEVQERQSFNEAANSYLPRQNAFAVATIKGYQILHINQIGYFEYTGETKIWKVHLSNHTSLQLKRGTTAETIIKYSDSFVQISQSIIININYLAMINSKECMLCPPFDNATGLFISRKYFKNLQEKFNFI